ncbi:MAG: glycogen debranching enzyme N-terminal domain-containing protein [Candidatus Omnitrophica bacterium]|nr:glycogen debranching enzyme N-terminal domain-containing protein [Candidatus Omnitrophota bacterium]
MANQLGGFASSTIISANTRRQHGLLIAQLKPPLGSEMLLSYVEEFLFIDDQAYPLSTQLFSNTVYPEGYRNLTEFSLAPFPTWTFRIEDLVIAKSVIFLYEEQTVLIRYQIAEGDDNLVRLELRPFTAFRDVKSLTRRTNRLNTKIETLPGRIRFAGLFFHHNAAILDQAGTWRLGFQYPEEKKLGLDFEEDLFSPFRLVYTFLKGREVFLCASLEDRPSIHPEVMISKEKIRRTNHSNPKITF